MVKDQKKLLWLVLFIFIGCFTMAIVDGVISPQYEVKALIKTILFLVLPLGYILVDRQMNVSQLLKIRWQDLLKSLALGLLVFGFILGSYFTIGRLFDFSTIASTLQTTEDIHKNNFIYIAIYISFFNSLLEEFFFRGFSFFKLKQVSSRLTAYIISSSAFALYHVSIMFDWGSPLLIILLLISLVVAGIMFNYLNEKSESIYTSWIVHMFANFAINTIGILLFEII